MGRQPFDGESGEGSEAGLEGGKLVRAGAFEAQDSAGVTLDLLGVGLIRPVARVDPEKGTMVLQNCFRTETHHWQMKRLLRIPIIGHHFS